MIEIKCPYCSKKCDGILDREEIIKHENYDEFNRVWWAECNVCHIELTLKSTHCTTEKYDYEELENESYIKRIPSD